MHDATSMIEVSAENLIFHAGENDFYYLGSPYAGTEEEMDQRAGEVWRQSGLMTKYGIPHYSPIWAKHKISKVFGLPGDVNFWWAENRPFLEHCCGLVIAAMPGWKKSNGLRREIAYVTERKKSVYLTEPVQPIGLRFYKIA